MLRTDLPSPSLATTLSPANQLQLQRDREDSAAHSSRGRAAEEGSFPRPWTSPQDASCQVPALCFIVTGVIKYSLEATNAIHNLQMKKRRPIENDLSQTGSRNFLSVTSWWCKASPSTMGRRDCGGPAKHPSHPRRSPGMVTWHWVAEISDSGSLFIPLSHRTPLLAKFLPEL